MAALARLPVAAALVAEGAWIAVVYALLQAASQEPIRLGPLHFALVAGLGLVAGGEGPRRMGGRWPIAAVGLVGLAAVAGWLLPETTRAALGSSDPGSALSTHPGGWLAGLALMRGVANARPASGEPAVGWLLAIASPLIIGAFLVGGAIAEPGRSAFASAALLDTVVFVGWGLVALALGRIGQLGGTGGFDWRRNPAWVGLLVVLVAASVVLALSAALSLGPVVILVVATLPVPLFVAGLLAGVDRRGRRILAIAVGVTVVAVVLLRLFYHPSTTGGGETGGGTPTSTPPDQAWMAVAGWTFVVIGLAVLVALLAALWMRQALRASDEDVSEERSIDHGDETSAPGGRAARRRWRLRAAVPRDAPEAYLAVVRELEADGGLRRLPDETPAEHARRIRGEARPLPVGGAVDLLAADYELARFGARELSARENLRGVARWRRVRAALRARARDRDPGAPDSVEG